MSQLPKHVAIILDGNGRWAKSRGKPRYFGHHVGARNIERIVSAAIRSNIECLSLWAFSTENWKRPKEEVNYLLQLVQTMAQKQLEKLKKNNIQVRVVGDRSRLSSQLCSMIEKSEKATAQNTGLKLIIEFNYSGRWDILQAVHAIAEEVERGQLKPLNIRQENFEAHLALSDFPDPDLIIRTGGELRLSNFCLWQLAYAELYFTETFWPDFDEKDFEKALLCYSKRQRRFGGLPADS